MRSDRDTRKPPARWESGTSGSSERQGETRALGYPVTAVDLERVDVELAVGCSNGDIRNPLDVDRLTDDQPRILRGIAFKDVSSANAEPNANRGGCISSLHDVAELALGNLLSLSARELSGSGIFRYHEQSRGLPGSVLGSIERAGSDSSGPGP